MKFLLVSLVTAFSLSAQAKCMRDASGEVQCGAGHCVYDHYGQVACATTRTGACIIDSFGAGHCGAGECVDDGDHQGVCSQIPGGHCWLNQNGIGICE